MPPPTPLAALRRQSVIDGADRPSSYSLGTWLASTRKAYAEAELVSRQSTGSDDDAERIYVALRRWAGLMEVVLKHPNYKSVMATRGPEWAQYNDMKPKLLERMQQTRACEEQLRRRDERLGLREDAGPSTPTPPSNGFASPPLSPAAAPSTSRPSQSPSNGFEPSSSAAKRGRPVSGSIAERMASLQGAGLDASSVAAPWRSTRPTSIEEEMAVDGPAAPTVEASASHPGLQPAAKARRPLPAPPGQTGPVLPGPSFPSSNDRPTSAPPATAAVLDDFTTSYPAMDDFEHRFPDAPREMPSDSLPSVPRSAPTSGARPLDGPLGRPPSPPRFDAATEMSRDESTSSVSSKSGLTRSPAMHKIAAVSSRSRDRMASELPAASTSSPRSLPFTSSIQPSELWPLLRHSSGSSATILLLDVRSREEHDRTHIAYAETVVIDPIALRNEVGSDRIEQALVLSPDEERARFERRDRYDLVVVLDRSSSMVPAPGVGTDESGRLLRNLTTAIFEREFRRTLKRAPIILVGGIDAWRRKLGSEGLIGTDVGQVRRASESAAPPPINHAARPLASSTGSPSDAAKRANRSAKVVGGMVDYAASSSQPARSVVETLVNSPYNQAPSSSYFNRQLSSSFSGNQSPIASPPMAVTSSQSPRNGSAPTFDYQAMAMPPYPAQPANGTPPRKPVDYPQLPPHAMPPTMQRPPLAAQPNGGVSARAPSNAQLAIAPPTRRLSSNHFQSTILPSPSDFGTSYSGSAALSSLGLNWGDGTIGMTGLKNLGNTCYMNSTLQCLSATIPFARFFKDGSYKRAVNTINPLGTKGALASAVASLITVLWNEQYQFVSPEAICHFAPQFRGTEQHDSQEFLAFLLDGLHEDLNFVLHKPQPVPMTPERELALETMPQAQASAKEWDIYLRRDNSIIVQWFQGQYRSKLTCMTCGKTSTTYNAFMYLSVPIPASRTLHKVTLEQCLEAFVKEEVLEKDDMWNCPRCKAPRKAQKKLSISRLPPILLIHLKRFSFRGIFSDRIDTNIHFPLHSLDLQGYLPADPNKGAGGSSEGSTVYDLYAVSQHFGTLSSGHYTAMVRARDRWNDIGDSKVRPCDDSDVRKATKSAYILYYRRRGN